MLKRVVSIVVMVVSLLGVHNAFAAVEINTADQAQLDSVAGIGPATSRAILEERKKNGNFKDWADLEQRVRGIGERNSVKLSAAGLTVNGQQRSAQTSAEKPVQPVKVSKSVKEPKAPVKADKEVPNAGDEPKGSDAKR